MHVSEDGETLCGGWHMDTASFLGQSLQVLTPSPLSRGFNTGKRCDSEYQFQSRKTKTKGLSNAVDGIAQGQLLP